MIYATNMNMNINNNSTTKTTLVAAALWVFVLSILSNNSGGVFVVVVNGMGVKNSDLPLFETSVTNCGDMLALHRWEGSCCSLNVTEGNGCILNVMNGNCVVKGQEWTLDYNSTYDKVPCPPSEYSAGDLPGTSIKPGPPTIDESAGASNTATTTIAAATTAATMMMVLLAAALLL